MDDACIIEMLCDWTAMSVKFKNIPSKWFDANKEKMVLHQDTIQTILYWLPIFDNVYSQMTEKAVNGKEKNAGVMILNAPLTTLTVDRVLVENEEDIYHPFVFAEDDVVLFICNTK